MQSSLGILPPPLAGVRVADLSRVLAGPYCTMVLADLGADVVKVERPRAATRPAWGPPFAGGEAAYYLSVNRGKRSCALDLSQPEGRALALELCAGADVVIENFKVGGAERLGVGYEQVRERNPRGRLLLDHRVRLASRAAGTPGLRLRGPGRDGLMSITGARGRAALQGRRGAGGRARRAARRRRHARRAARGGGRPHRGAAARQRPRGLVNVAQNALVTGTEPERHGNAHPNIVPYQDFETSSGRIAVAAANDGLFRALCAARPRLELAADARFATNAARVEHRRELIPLLEERCRERPAEEWVEALDAAGVPVGKVRSVPDALAAAAAAGRPATVTGRAPHRRPARPRGLADLGRHPLRRGSPRRYWASTPPRCCASSGRSAAERRSRLSATKRTRPAAPRGAQACFQCASSALEPAGVTPRPAR